MKQVIANIQELNPASVFYLKGLVAKLRPQGKVASANENLGLLTEILRNDPAAGKSLQRYIHRIVSGSNLLDTVKETGILPNSTFVAGLSRRIIQKALPDTIEQDDFRYVLNEVFGKKDDHKWVSEISDDKWGILFDTLGMKAVLRDPKVAEQLINGILILSHRITALGLEPEITDKLNYVEQLDSPFITQSEEVIRLVAKIRNLRYRISNDDTDFRQVRILLKQCTEVIREIRKRKEELGTSVSLTYLSVRLLQHIDRIHLLLDLFSKETETGRTALVSFFKQIVLAENKKSSLRYYISQNIDLLAYQVTEHASKTGEHYITTTRKEYWKLLFSAMGGGMIVGFLAMFKMLYSYMRLAPFGQAFAYSMNYAFGFILIHITHSTLATKQPAMTAQTIASSLDTKNENEVSLTGLAELVAKVWRSQFVSFAGNLIFAFSVPVCLSYLYFFISGSHFVSEEKAMHMIRDVHPLRSGSLVFAGIAGVYLFLSGLISGYFDNLVIYRNVPRRIENHPFLIRVMPQKITVRFARYLEQNMGSLAGNFFLGIFLGSTAMIGEMLGVHLDIRHITFSAGNIGIAFTALDFDVSWQMVMVTIAGIIGIGFMNFAVSFGLALYVAVKSRKITFLQYAAFLVLLRKYFFKHPGSFIFPPSAKKLAEITPNNPSS